MTKAQIKFIQSLGRQKYRKELNAYLVEGDKNAKEWLQSDCTIQYIVATKHWVSTNDALIGLHPEAECIFAEDFELEKITSLQTAQYVLLVPQKPAPRPWVQAMNEWSLFLEKIQDPGNMGTMIRTADWFGIRQIICTPDCVDIYNPKVVQASMGSLLRVNIVEMETEQLLREKNQALYAAHLDGSDMRTLGTVPPGIIAMGNESQGLSTLIAEAADYKITIPGTGSAESLNVSVATGILCAQLTLQH